MFDRMILVEETVSISALPRIILAGIIVLERRAKLLNMAVITPSYSVWL
jgi:hypothetical protein